MGMRRWEKCGGRDEQGWRRGRLKWRWLVSGVMITDDRIEGERRKCTTEGKGGECHRTSTAHKSL